VNFDPDVARVLLAGWISGAAVALAGTAIVLVVLSRDDGWRERFQRTTLRLPLVGVVVVNGMMLGWTLVGLIMGGIYLGTEQPAFSITVIVLLALGLVMWSAVRGRPGWAVLAMVGSALVSFAGLLPALAGS